MRCDLCDKPAVVHETMIRNGQKREVHLCAEHAAKQGYGTVAHQPLNQLLSNIAGSGTPKQATSLTCPSCGLTLAAFRQSGLLGCASCYETFAKQLETLVARAHAGATHHVGRGTNDQSGSIEREQLRSKLVRELEEAVAAEQYERAARLRDRIHGLSSPSGSE